MVHMDQNEKIGQRFGCTHVAMIDGCSRMICGYSSMPVKNPILIYEYVYRPALSKFGLWNQLRIDHGQEFSLCIFVQDLLKSFRENTEKAPWKQTASTDNNVIERLWPELNSRVNYPIKRAMINVTENHVDLSDPIVKYCVSWITNYVCQDSAKHLIDSWNFHRVPGPNGCVPVENMRETKRNAIITEPLLPSTPEAVKMYEDMGGSLTRNSCFGIDPLILNEEAYNSRAIFFESNQPTGKDLFSHIVHGKYDSLLDAIEYFYELSVNL